MPGARKTSRIIIKKWRGRGHASFRIMSGRCRKDRARGESAGRRGKKRRNASNVCPSNRFSLSSSSSPSTALMVPGSRFETPFPPSPPIIELFLYYYREQQLSPLLLLLLPTLNYFFQIFHYFFQTSLLSLRIRIKDYIGAMHAREDACNPRIGKFCTDP